MEKINQQIKKYTDNLFLPFEFLINISDIEMEFRLPTSIKIVWKDDDFLMQQLFRYISCNCDKDVTYGGNFLSPISISKPSHYNLKVVFLNNYISEEFNKLYSTWKNRNIHTL